MAFAMRRLCRVTSCMGSWAFSIDCYEDGACQRFGSDLMHLLLKAHHNYAGCNSFMMTFCQEMRGKALRYPKVVATSATEIMWRQEPR